MSVERSLVKPFDTIRVAVVAVDLTVGPPHQGVKLSGEAHVLEQIATRIEGQTLYIGADDGASFSTNVAIEASLSLPVLSGVQASAGARVSIEGDCGPRLNLQSASGARVKARGTAGALSAFAESGGMIDATEFRAGQVSCQSKSGGQIKS